MVAECHIERLMSPPRTDVETLVAECDQEQRFVTISAAYADRLNRRPLDVIGRPVREVVGEDLYCRMAPFIEKALQGYEVATDLDPIADRSESRESRCLYVPRVDAEGRRAGFLIGLVDMRARRDIERTWHDAVANIDAARRAAEETSRLKDEFLATASHELRTPLGAVIGWTRMLRGERLDSASRERAIDAIERNGRAAALLVEDLLDVSRIANGVLRIAHEPVDVSQLLSRSVEACLPAADAKHIRVATVPPEPTRFVRGDAMRLQQVLANVLTNAVRYTPPGGTIAVEAVSRAGEIDICVRDSGRGIAAANISSIFEKFRQADSSDRHRNGGLGLGLPIARHLVEMHGGRIRAESEGVGRGATFTITLPLDSGDAGVAPSRSSLAMAALDSSGLTVAGVRVLVLADASETTEFVCAALRSHSASVLVTTPADAPHAGIADSFDVLVCDVDARIDAFDVVHTLQAAGDGDAAIPAIALTSYARVNDRTRALAAGFHTSVRKPIDTAELIAAVAGLARLRVRDRHR
jgi:signal transduction histidine kinase